MSKWTAEMIRNALERNPSLTAVTQAIGVGGPGMNHICKQCGSPFFAWPSANRKYCSIQCAYQSSDRGKNIAKNQTKDRGIGICAGCGAEFKKHTKSGKGLYCSQRCAASTLGKVSIYNARKFSIAPDPSLKVTFSCKLCGKSVTRFRSTGQLTYCSNKCSSNCPDRVKRAVTSCRQSGRPRLYSRCSKGWIEVGGKILFVRSQWESNYAFYLQSLQDSGVIKSWGYETKTFWFDKIKRGVRSYLPDFEVQSLDDSTEYHEVKGWMDKKSKTKLKRMKKYFPSVNVVVRDERWFKWAKSHGPSMLPGWGTKPATKSPSKPLKGSAKKERKNTPK